MAQLTPIGADRAKRGWRRLRLALPVSKPRATTPNTAVIWMRASVARYPSTLAAEAIDDRTGSRRAHHARVIATGAALRRAHRLHAITGQLVVACRGGGHAPRLSRVGATGRANAGKIESCRARSSVRSRKNASVVGDIVDEQDLPVRARRSRRSCAIGLRRARDQLMKPGQRREGAGTAAPDVAGRARVCRLTGRRSL
jgi:hypothetical protein